MTPFRVEKKHLLDLKTTGIFAGYPQPCNMAGIPVGRNLVAEVKRGRKKVFIYCPNILDAQDITDYHERRDTTLTWYTAGFPINMQMRQLDSLSDMFNR